MNEKATLSAIREAYARPQGLFGHYGMEARAAEFDDVIAEVERAAAERAYSEAALAIQDGLGAWDAHEHNPYRAALGLTAGQEEGER